MSRAPLSGAEFEVAHQIPGGIPGRLKDRGYWHESEFTGLGIVTQGNPVTEITGTGALIQVTDTDGGLHPRRFYRISVRP